MVQSVAHVRHLPPVHGPVCIDCGNKCVQAYWKVLGGHICNPCWKTLAAQGTFAQPLPTPAPAPVMVAV